MNLAIFLFQGAPEGAGTGIFLGLTFFAVLSVIAFLAFWMLRKTLKMAFRMLMVGVILLIAIAGAIAFFALGVGGGKDAPSLRPKTSQTK
jgi:hypothetical protein